MTAKEAKKQARQRRHEIVYEQIEESIKQGLGACKYYGTLLPDTHKELEEQGFKVILGHEGRYSHYTKISWEE
jgi:hypothetical protein